ncbi:hypothetical protein ScPMuIL_010609 [Solemya velum]
MEEENLSDEPPEDDRHAYSQPPQEVVSGRIRGDKQEDDVHRNRAQEQVFWINNPLEPQFSDDLESSKNSPEFSESNFLPLCLPGPSLNLPYLTETHNLEEDTFHIPSSVTTVHPEPVLVELESRDIDMSPATLMETVSIGPFSKSGDSELILPVNVCESSDGLPPLNLQVHDKILQQVLSCRNTTSHKFSEPENETDDDSSYSNSCDFFISNLNERLKDVNHLENACSQSTESENENLNMTTVRIPPNITESGINRNPSCDKMFEDRGPTKNENLSFSCERLASIDGEHLDEVRKLSKDTSTHNINSKLKEKSSVSPVKNSDLPKDVDQCFFSSIPTEIILKILSFCSPQELCQNVSPVCKKWHSYAHEPSLWKCLCFDYNPNISSINLCWIVRKTPHLKKLVLRGRFELTLAECSVLSESCLELRELDLGFCDKLNQLMIGCFVENCKQLESITVEGCQLVTNVCVTHLVKLSRLTHLNFSHCALLDDSLILIADKLPQIVSLDIDGMSWITDSAVIHLVTLHQHNLECLVLDGAELTDAIFQTLSMCSKLRKLSLSFCELLSDVALQCIKKLPSLRNLKLRKGENFTSDGLRDLFLSPHFSILTELDLSECVCITNDTVLQISKCCGRALKTLSLCWCWEVTEIGLISIVDHCSNLRTLVLLGIHKITGDCLDRIPEEMDHLTFLDLRQCNRIKDQVIADMIRRKPDLKVLNYYGEMFVFSPGGRRESSDELDDFL